MTRDEIIRMAEAAGLVTENYDAGFMNLFSAKLEAFTALVAAAEREACIALHDHEDVQAPIGNSAWGEAHQEGWINGTSAYRDAIRARGEKGQS